MTRKVVLIVGASSALGCEIIREIAAPDVLILAHCHAGKQHLLDLQAELPCALVPIAADLSSPDGIQALMMGVAEHCTHPQQLVLLAAPKLELKRFKSLQWQDFKAQLDVQLQSAVALLSAYLPKMALAKNGKVVFMLSSYTLGTPPAALAHYITAKYALLGLMKALAAEYAAKEVSINAVSPSMLETPFLKDIPDKIIEITADQHPKKRNGLPTDVAPLVKFLLSDGAGFMSGVNIPVSGGQ